jgi:glycosyltransferase involved in cell wall biosynthesis
VTLLILGGIPRSYMDLVGEKVRSIKFLGKVKHADLKYYFSSANVLLLPMDNSNIEKARFPIRFGDYIASGTPILAAPNGEIKKLIEENKCCVVFDIDNQKDFDNKLSRCIDEINVKLYAQNALNLAQEISWANLTKSLVEIYNAK